MSRDFFDLSKFVERFEAVRAHYGLKKSEFARKLNVTNGFYSDFTNGNTKASYKMLVGLSLNFQYIDIHWLMTGKGNMLFDREYQAVSEEIKSFGLLLQKYPADKQIAAIDIIKNLLILTSDSDHI